MAQTRTARPTGSRPKQGLRHIYLPHDSAAARLPQRATLNHRSRVGSVGHNASSHGSRPASISPEASHQKVDFRRLTEQLTAAAGRHGQTNCRLSVDQRILTFKEKPLRLLATWSTRDPRLPEMLDPYRLAPWYTMDRRRADRARRFLQTLFWGALVRNEAPSLIVHVQCFLVILQSIADDSWRSRAAAADRTRPPSERVLDSSPIRPEFLLTYQLSQNWGELLRRFGTLDRALVPTRTCLSHAAADHVAIDVPDTRGQKALRRMWAVVERCGKDLPAHLRAIRRHWQHAMQSATPPELPLCPEAEGFLETFAEHTALLPPGVSTREPLRAWTPYHQRALHSCLVALLASLSVALRTVECLAEQARALRGAARRDPGEAALASLWDAGNAVASTLLRLSTILSQPDLIDHYRRHIATAALHRQRGCPTCCVPGAIAAPTSTCVSADALAGTTADQGFVTIADLAAGVAWMADANLALETTLRSLHEEGYALRGRILEVVEYSPR